jgi:hypothetical protein
MPERLALLESGVMKLNNDDPSEIHDQEEKRRYEEKYVGRQRKPKSAEVTSGSMASPGGILQGCATTCRCFPSIE